VSLQRKEASGGKQFGSDIANFKRVFFVEIAAWQKACRLA